MMEVPLEISLERDQLRQVVSVDGDTVLIGRGSRCDMSLRSSQDWAFAGIF